MGLKGGFPPFNPIQSGLPTARPGTHWPVVSRQVGCLQALPGHLVHRAFGTEARYFVDAANGDGFIVSAVEGIVGHAIVLWSQRHWNRTAAHGRARAVQIVGQPPRSFR